MRAWEQNMGEQEYLASYPPTVELNLNLHRSAMVRMHIYEFSYFNNNVTPNRKLILLEPNRRWLGKQEKGEH